MNKKGFTLVEILAVIVLLAIVITLVATKGFGVLDNSKEKIYDLAKDEIENGVKILMTEIEHCDEYDEELLDIDSQLATANNLPTPGKSSIECIDYKRIAANSYLEIPLRFLIEKGYITGNNAKKLYEISPNMKYEGEFTLEDADDLESNIKEITISCLENCNDDDEPSEGESLTREKTLYESILSRTSIYNTNLTITGVEINNKSGMYKAEDDYGTSYYYRGAVEDNYVSFAGFTWRVVRINGDRSIRLILDGTLDKVKKDGIEVKNNGKLSLLSSDGKVPFNTKYNDNAYVGYMYGNFTGNSTSYDQAHKNEVSSTIKTYIDAFYEEYLKSYESNLADTLFCGDKTLANSSIGLSNTTLGYGKNKTFYAAEGRLYYSSGTTLITTASPTLKCAEGASNTYSRYTANETETTKGIPVNSDLTYPIGLLSADELVLAGAWRSVTNNLYYLFDEASAGIAEFKWWTMTPSHMDSTYSLLYNTISNSYSLHRNYSNVPHRVRPVINLKSDNLISGGIGTKASPYIIKEA